MKLIGYPHAGKAPWAPLDNDDVEWRTAQDIIEDYESRGFHYSDELVSRGLELSNLNSKMICMKCNHAPVGHLQARWDFLWKEEHRLAADLNPPVYAVGDILDFRMFPTDPPERVRIKRTDHFDLINGRVYHLEFLDQPEMRIPGADLGQLSPAAVRNIECEVALARRAVSAAHVVSHNLGPWRNQRSSYQRQAWQKAKLDRANAERELYHLLAESKFPQQKLLPPCNQTSTSSITNSAGDVLIHTAADEKAEPSGPAELPSLPAEVLTEPIPTSESFPAYEPDQVSATGSYNPTNFVQNTLL